jgi:dipeptidyl aminopeptidase/acylaminoacyl peptidase
MIKACSWRLTALCLLVLAFVAPGVTTAAPPPLSVYGNLPSFEMAALSPSGDRVALVGVVAGVRRLLVVDKDNKALLASNLGDQKVASIDWAGEDKVLVRIFETVDLGIGFTAKKAELSSMMVVPVDGQKPWVVFEGNNYVAGGVLQYAGVLEREGRWFGYFAGITLEAGGAGGVTLEPMMKSSAPELYEVDLQTRKTKRVAKRGELRSSRNWLVGAAGELVAFSDFYSWNGNWRIMDRNGRTLVSGTKPQGGIGLVSLGRTRGTILYWDQDEGTGKEQWYELPLTGGRPVELLAGESVLAIRTDRRTRQLIGFVRDGDVPSDQFFDPRRNKIMAATRRAFPGLNVRLIDSSDSFERLLIRTDGVGDPGTWWLVDIKTGKATDLGVSYPIGSSDVGPMRMFRYKAGDGLGLEGVLTLPPRRDAKKLPVVVLPHGGPWARDYAGFDWIAQAFASRGYAVFQPNFRGSTGYGPAFETAGDGEWGRKMQTDISDGLAELVRQGIVDGDRACIMGASYGGYAALAGVTLQQGIYRCAVSVAGVSDVERLYSTWMRETNRDQTTRRWANQAIGKGRDLRSVSPIRFADRVTAPVLLIHGTNDTVVLPEQSSNMANALRKAGKEAELLTLDKADHWLLNGETRLAMLEAAYKFIERHNPPDRVE